jgi:hemolysin III
MTNPLPAPATWWKSSRQFSLAERITDGIVHGIGLANALGLGIVLIVFASLGTARAELVPIIIYFVTLLAVFSISLAYNLAPASGFKQVMARLDQAAIFLFIAGTYTPFLAVMGRTTTTMLLTVAVWGMALIGVWLKLIVPDRFGRIALVLYLAIGWSGVLVFQTLAAVLPAPSFWLVIAGGITYSVGIIFHVWERLKFNNVLWHVFVVAGSVCHLWAVFWVMVLDRL